MFLRIGLGSIISLALKNYLWMGCAGLPMSSWEADTCEDGLTQPEKMLKTTPGLSCSVQAPCRERWNLSWPFNWHVPSWQNIKEDATQKRHDFRKELPIYGMHEDMGHGSQPLRQHLLAPMGLLLHDHALLWGRKPREQEQSHKPVKQRATGMIKHTFFRSPRTIQIPVILLKSVGPGT